MENESGAGAEVQALLHKIYRRKIETAPGESISVWLARSNRKLLITTMITSVMAPVMIYIFQDVLVRYGLERVALFIPGIGALAIGTFIMLRSQKSVNRSYVHSIFSEYPEANYPAGGQKFNKKTQDGNASQKQTAGISQLPGLNSSESGDISLQRAPTESASDEGRSKQDSNPTEARTHNWPVVEERDANFGQGLWVVACFRNSKGDDQVVQVRVSDRTKDSILFFRFRQEYFRISSWWRRFVKMQEVTAIRFVMVKTHASG